MPTVAVTIGILAVVSLGLTAGAVLAEAGVLVPFWRWQEPEAFLAWYRTHADLLLGFFGPLEVASAVLVLAATVLAWRGRLPGRASFTAATLLTVAILASFPLYFQAANASFADGSLPVAAVAAELSRWAAWHWVRTGFAILAFLLAALAMAPPANR